MTAQAVQTQNNTESMADKAIAARPDIWSGFIMHPGNELATGAIRMLAEGQTEGFSPLLLVGESGSGKTRFLEMLVAETLRQRPGASITNLDGATLSQWVSDLRKLSLEAGEEGGTVNPHSRHDPDSEFDEWSHMRERLREVDLLIVDCLEDLEGRSAALEELEHAIDVLGYRESAAIVLTAKAMPKSGPKSKWPARFLGLLGGGLVVRLSMPDESARRRFILKWSASRSVTIPPEMVDQIATEPLDFGGLKGRLEKIRLHAKVSRKPIAPDILAALDELQKADNPPREKPTVRDVAKAVAKAYHLKLSDLRGPSRQPGIVRPRHVAIWLARQYSGLSFDKIAEFFGGRDPATIRHAIRQIDIRRINDPVLDEQLATLILKFV